MHRRAGKPDAALAIVRTDRGKIYMDRIRAAVSEMEAAERQLIAQRGEESRKAAAVSLAVTLGGAGDIGVLDCRRCCGRFTGFPSSAGTGLDPIRPNGPE